MSATRPLHANRRDRPSARAPAPIVGTGLAPVFTRAKKWTELQEVM
jgi:hypothetical protein